MGNKAYIYICCQPHQTQRSIFLATTTKLRDEQQTFALNDFMRQATSRKRRDKFQFMMAVFWHEDNFKILLYSNNARKTIKQFQGPEIGRNRWKFAILSTYVQWGIFIFDKSKIERADKMISGLCSKSFAKILPTSNPPKAMVKEAAGAALKS